METRAVTKARNGWPSIFDNTGWLDKFFNAPIDEYFNTGRVMNVPSVNVVENDGVYVLTMATPGLEKSDIKLEMKEGMMTISAEKEKEEEKGGHYNRREYNYTSWSRSFTLPENCDDSKINAEYKNGELKITIPKTELKPAETARTIAIS